jgi:competence protein ComFC
VLSYLKNALEIIYPIHCGGCNLKADALCTECTGSLRPVDPSTTCPVCGSHVGYRIVCGKCMDETRGFQEGHYGFYYENRLRDAVHAFKFSGRKDVGRRLVRLLRDRLVPLSGRLDCILPIPVTESRLKERGYNQSFIISEEIAKIVSKPIYHTILQKTKETKDQYSLSREDRKRNVKGAFAVRNGSCIKGKRILLVDDLYTTGYTAREACKVLSRSKPSEIIFFALARTPA